MSFRQFLFIALLLGSQSAFGQALSPSGGNIVVPTALHRSDATLSIGYGQLPKEVSSPSAGKFNPAAYRDKMYVVSLQFIPRISLHYKQSFKVAEVVQYTGDRVLGMQAALLLEKKRQPGIAVGIRDAGGTRKHHATYAVVSKSFAFGPVRPALSLGYSKHFLDASFLEMEDGIFYSASISMWDRVEALLDYDTRFHYAGVRIWPLKWIWVTGFVAEWEHPGFAFGISHVLFGSQN